MGQGDHDPGALQAFKEAKEEGLIDHIGLTSHGDPASSGRLSSAFPNPETVMFLLNYTLDAKAGPEYDYGSVLELAEEGGPGDPLYQGLCERPWPEDLPEDERPYDTWYEPYDTREISSSVYATRSRRGMTSIPNAGDPDLVPLILEAARDYESMSYDEQAELRECAREAGTRPCPGTEEDDGAAPAGVST